MPLVVYTAATVYLSLQQVTWDQHSWSSNSLFHANSRKICVNLVLKEKLFLKRIFTI